MTEADVRSMAGNFKPAANLERFGNAISEAIDRAIAEGVPLEHIAAAICGIAVGSILGVRGDAGGDWVRASLVPGIERAIAAHAMPEPQGHA